MQTKSIGIFFQTEQIVAALVIFFAVFHVDAVQNDVIVQRAGVDVRGDQHLIFRERFSETQADLMGGLLREIVLGREGLDEVIILPPVLLVKLLLDENKFVQCRIGAAVYAADQLVIGCLPAGDVTENVAQRAA